MIACEILWDCFPDGNRLGGATFNVAYHLNQLGVAPRLIASVGSDALGDQALRVIEEDWKCDTHWIRRLDTVPTGRVNVTIDTSGDATYDVIAPVSWDFVEIPPESVAGCGVPLMFPSVGLRSEFNRDQIRRTLESYKGLKCFDANLRPPHNSVEIVLEFAALADFMKMNEEELAILAAGTGSSAREPERQLTDLAHALDLDMMCVTRAEQPAFMLHGGEISFGESYPTVVKDTVGAGDAFMASIIASLSREGFDAPEALSRASRLGSWVASQAGAQPLYDHSIEFGI